MGGNDIPASGFALYLDRLMDLVKQEITTGLYGIKILVKAENVEMKEAFKLASGLHDAGYIAEIYTGDKEPGDENWLIEVQGEEPHFIVKETASQEVSEASTKNEVLKILASGL